MAKWVTSIKFIEDFEDIDKGNSSWHDDALHYSPNSAEI